MADVFESSGGRPAARPVLPPAGELTAEGRSRLGLDAAASRAYRNMVLIRRADQEALNLQRQASSVFWGQFLGQEAIHVGAMTALRTIGLGFPQLPRVGMGDGPRLDPADMLTLFRGLSHDPVDPRRYHFAPLAIPVATLGSHPSVRHGLAAQAHGRGRALYSLCDAPRRRATWHEAMTSPASSSAPVVFLCQNNYWAISVPPLEQPPAPSRTGPGLRVPRYPSDGNDVLGVYAAVGAAADRARQGERPYLIEGP